MESETGYSKRVEDIKPKQEAAVKGMSPDQPAPSMASRVAAQVATGAAQPASQGGLMAWVKSHDDDYVEGTAAR